MSTTTQPGAAGSEVQKTPQAAPRLPLVELQGLSVCFGEREILHGLTASLGGRAIGLLGPNGAGKSTLINTLLGFYPPSAGSARVFGCDIRTEKRKIRGQVGYMPENDAFISKMTAVSLVQMMGELSGLPKGTALERAHEALFYVGLSEARYRELGTYSLGMKQLAKLAQSIVHGPKLLILDEPTNGLDPSARQRMIRMIREMRDSGEVRILLCSHLLRDVEDTCDEVLILKQGRIAHYSDLNQERQANRRFLEMEFYGANGDFTAAIEKLGCDCAVRANRMKIVLADGVESRDIFRLAAERDVRIRKLNFRRDTLEDIFLKAMEN
ncbi:MAG: ABC transporter ATP-binding protein [Candidatus Sulfotelmatobacter sp.]